ncbi:MAG TPA: CopG family transcriptional regulator [Candidatus Nanopelagicaceae bacterium]|nr:CopG family transcriptional regulator [Candidatus Nanopelagicaceae bacterium]
MAKRKTTLHLHPDLRTATKAVALASGRSESEVMAEALRRYLGAGHALQAGRSWKESWVS